MSRLQKLEFETKNITERVRKQMSVYSNNVRYRLNHIAHFQNEFDNAFNGYIENALPRDETFLRLETEMEAQRQIKLANKNGTSNVLGNPRVLPKVQTKEERVKERVDRAHGEKEMRFMKEDEER